MKKIAYLFIGLYTIGPLLMVPIIAYYLSDWYVLLGILACYIGTLIGAWVPKALIPLLLIPIGVWIAKGFDIQSYFTLFSIFIASGCLSFILAQAYLHEIEKQEETKPL